MNENEILDRQAGIKIQVALNNLNEAIMEASQIGLYVEFKLAYNMEEIGKRYPYRVYEAIVERRTNILENKK